MLDYIRGRLARAGTGEITVEAGGLGFIIRVADGSAFRPVRGGEITVPVQLEPGGGEPFLVGFGDEAERADYRELRRIQGVGPATALRLLARVGELRAGTTAVLDEIKGLGPKRRAGIMKWLKRPDEEGGSEKLRAVRSALAGLGMKAAEARVRAGRALKRNPGAALEDLVRLAVKG